MQNGTVWAMHLHVALWHHAPSSSSAYVNLTSRRDAVEANWHALGSRLLLMLLTAHKLRAQVNSPSANASTATALNHLHIIKALRTRQILVVH